VTSKKLARGLAEKGLAVLSAAEWEALAPRFKEIERHATGIAGDLVIVEDETGLLAVEAPRRDERVVRRLADPESVRRFVEERLAKYERMWDGCGCRVNHYQAWKPGKGD
jgi:hypothetical protein